MMAGDDGQAAPVIEVDDAANPAHAQLNEPIVGTEMVPWDDKTGPGGKLVKPLPSVKSPTHAMWAKHRLARLPYCL